MTFIYNIYKKVVSIHFFIYKGFLLSSEKIEIVNDEVGNDLADQGYLLKKPVGAIYLKCDSMTKLSRRTFNILLKNAESEMLTTDVHVMDLAKFKIGINSDSNTNHLKTVLKKIMGTVVEFNYINRDKKNVWTASALISDASIVGQTVSYSFPKTLRSQLADPEIYALIDSRVQNKFSSVYAEILYEWVEDWYRKDAGKGETPFFTIQQFREMMGVENKKSYQLFANLKRVIIEGPIEEINHLTDFIVKCKLRKFGRNYTHIKFLINKIMEISEKCTLVESLPERTSSKIKEIPLKILQLIPENQRGGCNQICLEILNSEGSDALIYYITELKKGSYTQNQKVKHWGKVLRGSNKNPGPVTRRDYQTALKKHETLEKEQMALEAYEQKQRNKAQREKEQFTKRYRLVNALSEKEYELFEAYIRLNDGAFKNNPNRKIVDGTKIRNIEPFLKQLRKNSFHAENVESDESNLFNELNEKE